MAYDLTVIIPTYNERENIIGIIHEIRAHLKNGGINGEILVMDDNSPDHTADIVREISTADPDTRVIVRTKDRGLSQSVVDGFSEAWSDVFVVIDADFSHPTDRIIPLYQTIQAGYDIVIASRYTRGGGTENWGMVRRAISSGATFLAKLYFPGITDPVGGFFAIRRSVISGAELKPSGYKILTEILGKGRYTRVAEIPYTFTNRKRGSSKLGQKQIVEYVAQLFDILKYASKHHDTPVWKEVSRVLKFMVVGVSGIFINLMMLYALVGVFSVNLMVAGMISIETAIVSNFLLNDFWTFGDAHERHVIQRIISFHLVSFGGAAINLIILLGLTYIGVWYMFAQIVGIFIAFAWNFIVNRRSTWTTRRSSA